MDHPIPDPFALRKLIEARMYWQPLFRDSVAAAAGFSDFVTYVRATHTRPSAHANHSVLHHTVPVTLADDDDATALTMRSQITALRAENASLRSRAPTSSGPGGDGVSVLGSVGASTAGGAPAVNERVENPNFDTTLFGWARDAARAGDGPKMVASSTLKRLEATGKVPPLPRSRVDPSTPMCFAWHVVGQCNGRCKRARDHVAYASDSPQYVKLARWARVCYKVKEELDAALPIESLE